MNSVDFGDSLEDDEELGLSMSEEKRSMSQSRFVTPIDEEPPFPHTTAGTLDTDPPGGPRPRRAMVPQPEIRTATENPWVKRLIFFSLLVGVVYLAYYYMLSPQPQPRSRRRRRRTGASKKPGKKTSHKRSSDASSSGSSSESEQSDPEEEKEEKAGKEHKAEPHDRDKDKGKSKRASTTGVQNVPATAPVVRRHAREPGILRAYDELISPATDGALTEAEIAEAFLCNPKGKCQLFLDSHGVLRAFSLDRSKYNSKFALTSETLVAASKTPGVHRLIVLPPACLIILNPEMRVIWSYRAPVTPTAEDGPEGKRTPDSKSEPPQAEKQDNFGPGMDNELAQVALVVNVHGQLILQGVRRKFVWNMLPS